MLYLGSDAGQVLSALSTEDKIATAMQISVLLAMPAGWPAKSAKAVDLMSVRIGARRMCTTLIRAVPVATVYKHVNLRTKPLHLANTLPPRAPPSDDTHLTPCAPLGHLLPQASGSGWSVRTPRRESCLPRSSSRAACSRIFSIGVIALPAGPPQRPKHSTLATLNKAAHRFAGCPCL
eukprot:COSAG04_NODE_5549_length_1573_cov_3.755088_2_plen_178_part_00